MAITSPTPDALSQEVETIQQKLDRLRAIQSQSRNVVVLLAVLLTAMSVAFVLLTYNRVKNNFNDVAVQSAFADAAPRVLPLVGSRLLNASYSLLPEYRQKALQRLQIAGPEVATETRKRFVALPNEISAELMPKVQKTVDDVVAKLTPELSTQLGSLTDEKKQALLTELHERLVKDVTARANAVSAEQVDALSKILAKFDVDDRQKVQEPDKSERQFLHSLVMLMDHEMTSTDGAVEIPSGTSAMPTLPAGAVTSPQP